MLNDDDDERNCIAIGYGVRMCALHARRSTTLIVVIITVGWVDVGSPWHSKERESFRVSEFEFSELEPAKSLSAISGDLKRFGSVPHLRSGIFRLPDPS